MYYIKWVRKSNDAIGHILNASYDRNRVFSSPAEALDYLKNVILTTNAWGLEYFDYILEQQTIVVVGKLESKTIIDWV